MVCCELVSCRRLVMLARAPSLCEPELISRTLDHLVARSVHCSSVVIERWRHFCRDVQGEQRALHVERLPEAESKHGQRCRNETERPSSSPPSMPSRSTCHQRSSWSSNSLYCRPRPTRTF